jgi:hypothetical protein
VWAGVFYSLLYRADLFAEPAKTEQTRNDLYMYSESEPIACPGNDLRTANRYRQRNSVQKRWVRECGPNLANAESVAYETFRGTVTAPSFPLILLCTKNLMT